MTLHIDLHRPRASGRPSPVMSGSLVVMKFGSSILASPADAPKVASDIYAEVRRGRRVIAVVSAFAGETDRLMQEASDLGLPHDNSMLPSYVVQGEERAAALVGLACDRIGLDAATLTVRELGIVASGPSDHARPVGLDRTRLDRALTRHDVVVVPGFGALSPEGRVVLLGRGGSDLTALFLADELGLDSLQLIKDVDGLYDRDPNLHADARRYDMASWMEAKALGGGLVQPDALDLAEKRKVKLEVRNYLDGHRTVIGSQRAIPRLVPACRPLRVAIAGCGVVGGGALSRLLTDPRIEVTGVLVRDLARPRDVPGADRERISGLLVGDADRLMEPRPDILVEALSDADAGDMLIRAALEAGVDVVSASKQVVSRDPAGLLDLAAARNCRILWSAAVGGGTPMIETIRSARTAGPIVMFEAVLNGTVNFMLERMDDGAYFDVALAEARAAGFAEEDPAADLEGRDAAAKIRLLAFEAFGVMPALKDIDCEALSSVSFPRHGTRQISRCRLGDGGPMAEVRLTRDGLNPVLRNLRGERNALSILQLDGTTITCRGRGAGRWATAESVLADVSDLAAGRRRP